MKPAAIPALSAAVLLAVLGAGGCVTTTADGRPVQEPPPAPQPPAEAIPDAMVLSASIPVDTDANGYVDSFSVVAFLFAEQQGYPLSVAVPGEFTFRLTGRGGQDLAVWRFSPEEAAKHVTPLAPGPGYAFTLRLQDVGTDKLTERSADLRASFMPLQGPEVQSRGAATLLLRQ